MLANSVKQTTDKSNFLRAEAELILDEARKVKAERIKDLGSPIQLTGVALGLHIRDNYAWIAENTAVIRKLNLETGRTVQLFKGHTSPVTAIAFHDKVKGSGDEKVLISGAWDKSIILWDVDTKRVLSTTVGHSDFVKSLLVIPSLGLLVSSSSDKIVRFWDLSSFEEGKPLTSAGSTSAHTRPVEALASRPLSDTSAILYTADTMGIIKVWELTKEQDTPGSKHPPRWHCTPISELTYHRTKITDMVYGAGQLWTASADETAQAYDDPPVQRKVGERAMPPLVHPASVRAVLPLGPTSLAEPYVLTGAGDVIRAYDVSSPDEPELLGETDAHWHDVIALRLWMRRTVTKGGADGAKVTVEPWIVSASLDGTVRKWRLADLLQPPKKAAQGIEPTPAPAPTKAEKKDETFSMTEEEERELAELMDSD